MSNIAFLFLPLAFSSLPAVLPFVSPSSQVSPYITVALKTPSLLFFPLFQNSAPKLTLEPNVMIQMLQLLQAGSTRIDRSSLVGALTQITCLTCRGASVCFLGVHYV